jgi:hypothetical protein
MTTTTISLPTRTLVISRTNIIARPSLWKALLRSLLSALSAPAW